jgi:hypothetical protein
MTEQADLVVLMDSAVADNAVLNRIFHLQTFLQSLIFMVSVA